MTILVVGALVCICISHTLSSPTRNATREAELYLRKFGYFGDAGSQTSALLTAKVITNSLKDFQRFSGLNVTGVLDEKTLALMRIPRCGVKDIIGHANSARRRRKRYALQGSKWRKSHLFYRISKYPGKLKDRGKVDKEIQKAFKTWSDVTPLIFEQRQTRGRASIDIRFEENEHFNEENQLAGEGNTLAHAHFPESGGDIHFNDDEEWTIDQQTDDGYSLLNVATHEVGHSLGLLHSDENSSIMTSLYDEFIPKVTLDFDDVKAIQSLYGTREIYSLPEEDDPSGPSDTSGAPNLCQDSSIDTVTMTQNGSTYVFKGVFYWKVIPDGIANGYPRRISQDWGGLEGNLDASFTWASGKTYFFKDSRYWRFTNREMDFGYPRLLNQGFEGIPDGLDAAFVWGGNGKTYFFKGDKYWRYDSNNDPPVSYKYPRPLSIWKGLPTAIDAAFQFKNGRTYFFKGDKYYRYNDAKFQVDEGDPPFPRRTSEGWFKC